MCTCVCFDYLAIYGRMCIWGRVPSLNHCQISMCTCVRVLSLTQQISLPLMCICRQDDVVEAELCKELENGRLFRLLSKLGFINERPEYVACLCEGPALVMFALSP